jgi:hypothetical protein
MLLFSIGVLDVLRNNGLQGTRSILRESTAVAVRLPEDKLVNELGIGPNWRRRATRLFCRSVFLSDARK